MGSWSALWGQGTCDRWATCGRRAGAGAGRGRGGIWPLQIHRIVQPAGRAGPASCEERGKQQCQG
eukprot:5329783-Pyramimonas_sp.AAC.1